MEFSVSAGREVAQAKIAEAHEHVMGLTSAPTRRARALAAQKAARAAFRAQNYPAAILAAQRALEA